MRKKQQIKSSNELSLSFRNNGSSSEQISEALSEYRVLDQIPQSNPVDQRAQKSASLFRFRRKKSISNSLRRRRSASITPESPASNLVQKKNFMTIEQLKDFLHNVQHISPLSIEDSARLIARFEPSSEGRQCEEIGVDGLRLLLLHDEFCLFNADKLNRVYHDMTRPLTDYFIATSHNTFAQQIFIFSRFVSVFAFLYFIISDIFKVINSTANVRQRLTFTLCVKVVEPLNVRVISFARRFFALSPSVS